MQGGAAWDHEVDVLVVGSGAGAMVAAVTAAQRGGRTLVIEKSGLYGGTSATSGGGVWIPASRSAREAGAEDSPEEAFQYIKALVGETVAEARIWAFVRTGRDMVDYLEASTELRFQAIPYTDYQAELPGGKMGYRSHETQPMHADELSARDFETLRPVHPGATLFGYIPWTTMEAGKMVTRAKGWVPTLCRVLWRYYSDVPQRLKSRRSRFLVFGNSIIGKLKKALDQYGGVMWLDTSLLSLVREEGLVIGAIVQRDGRTQRIHAARGIVLAAGGFERNLAMRSKHLPGPTSPDWSGSQENNTGDAINAGVEVGAALDLMNEAWWAPTVKVPSEPRARPLFFERALPGCIMVNQAGRRYMNEARSYDIAGKAMLDCDKPGAGTAPSWVIFDAAFRRKYPMGPIMPVFPDFTLPREVQGMMVKAGSVARLAEKIGLPSAILVETMARFNVGARKGEDPDFGRGQRPYDRYYGDPSVKPNPNLKPIEKAPFYAVRVFPGDIGTKGGLLTDERARVLDEEGRPIRGLYAIGNTSASVMGASYPGAGSTLGPAMTFGFIAARDALAANA